MEKEESLQQKAQEALNKAIHEVNARHFRADRPLAVWKNGETVMKMQKGERINKHGKEFIVLKYSANRFFVVVVDQNGNIVPKFPFNTLEEAKRWIEQQK